MNAINRRITLNKTEGTVTFVNEIRQNKESL